YSSRFAPLLTSAVVEAADRVAETIRIAAGVLLEADPATLEIADGQVRVAGAPERSVKFRHAAGLVHWDPGSLPDGVDAQLGAEAAFTPPQSTAPSRTDKINSSLCYGFVAELVQVRIDPETYEIAIERVHAVHDLGAPLYEDLTHSETGRPTATFMDSLVPTPAEAAFPLTGERQVTPSPLTNLGAKGSGEGSSMSFPAAVAGAVEDALSAHGVEISSLPLHGNVIHDLLETT